jgi:uncharacterized membrane protein YjjP (DUF1212 family)
MTEERSELSLALARVLFVNGQATDQIVASIQRLTNKLGLKAELLPRWGELQLRSENDGAPQITSVEADPVGVDMDRVVSTMQTVADIEAGRLSPEQASKRIEAVAKAPPAPAWLFALAAAAAAVALAIIFGIHHELSALLIFLSSGAGAFLRRAIARVSTNIFLQPFCAALLAGLIGGLAVHYQLSTALRLVVVCPCMVLVPGPHILNGTLDLIAGRIHLGSARLIYAGLVVVAISTGLLLGLVLMRASLPIDPPGHEVPLWLDVIAAGVAVGLLQRLLLDTNAHAAMAGRGRHAGACVALGCHGRAWGRRGNRGAGGLRRRRLAAHTSVASLPLAVRGYRLRFRGLYDTRRLRLQDDERADADRRYGASDVGACRRDNR